MRFLVALAVAFSAGTAAAQPSRRWGALVVLYHSS